MHTYLILKHSHMGFALLSVSLFSLRGMAMLNGWTWLQSKPMRILPHVLDTLLLASAVLLASYLRLNPLGNPWLLAKIAGLIAYILLGNRALKTGRSRASRRNALLAALLVVAYNVCVAFGKHVWPFPYLPL
jgi:uncharacterized membrane protein SirB2